MLVREVMTHRPVTTHPRTPTKEALRLLDEHQITSMAVVDGENRIVGVVSEADLLRESLPADARAHMILPEEEPHPDRPRTVGEVMNRHPLAVHGESDLAEAVDLMTSTAVKSLPVLDDRRRVVGMISRRDVVHLLARDDDQVERELDDLYREAGVDWLVRVENGVATVEGPQDAKSRSMAESLAATVPGVTGVQILEASGSSRRREGGPPR
jgi:CBS domain-containing protein